MKQGKFKFSCKFPGTLVIKAVAVREISPSSTEGAAEIEPNWLVDVEGLGLQKPHKAQVTVRPGQVQLKLVREIGTN